MTPDFEILDANDAYLGATMRQRDSLAGIDMFEAFPDNPELDDPDGVTNLRQSLIAARSSGSRKVMPVQRYDVMDADGNWRLRYWRPMNWPVLDENGSVLALVHHVVDVTHDVLAEQASSGDILFRRAQAACDEALRLKSETRNIIDLMISGFSTGTRPYPRR